MFYDDNARQTIGNVFEYVLIAAQRGREINTVRNRDGTNSQLIDKNSGVEFPHQQIAREIASGKIGREYLDKLRSRSVRNH